MVYKIGTILTVGLDNIIITRFVGLGWVGLLSNYNLITGGVASLLNTIMTAATGSVGNINAKDEDEQKDRIYRLLLFVSFWLYGFSTIAYLNLLNPFIVLWFGKKYLLNIGIVLVIALNAYFAGVQMPTILFRDTLGLYKCGKYRPILGAIINLVISVAFVRTLGVLGVLLGTLGSRVLAMTWYEPMTNYKYGIKKSPKKFFEEYILYFMGMILAMGITYGINRCIVGYSLSIFVIRVLVVVFVPNILFVLLFHKISHFNYTYKLIQTYLIAKFRREKRNG